MFIHALCDPRQDRRTIHDEYEVLNSGPAVEPGPKTERFPSNETLFSIAVDNSQ